MENGFRVTTSDRPSPVRSVGEVFALHLSQSIHGRYKTSWPISWESLTPETIEVTNAAKGIFHSIAPGTAVVRAIVYDHQLAESATSAPQPFYIVETIVIKILPVRKLQEVGPQTFVAVGGLLDLRFNGYRPSVDTDPDKAAVKNKQVDDLPLRTNKPPTKAMFEPLESDSLVTVESLNPDHLLVSAPQQAAVGKVVVPNASIVELRGVSSGPATLRVSCGGCTYEFPYVVSDPELKIAVPAKAPVKGKDVEVSVTICDKQTGAILKSDSDLSVVVTDASGKAFEQNPSAIPMQGKLTYHFDLPGTYLVKANASVGSAKLSASSTLPIRDTVASLQFSESRSELVLGDTASIPFNCLGSAGLVDVDPTEFKISVQADKSDDNLIWPVSVPVCSVSKVATGLVLHISTPPAVAGDSGLHGFTVHVAVDGLSDVDNQFNYSTVPPLVIRSTEISQTQAKDLFGGQVANEFIVRRLSLTNNLRKVRENTTIKGKDILVYGNSVVTEVIVSRQGGNLIKGHVDDAVHDFNAARYGHQVDVQTYESRLRNFFVSSDPGDVIILAHNPVLVDTFNTISQAIESRSSNEHFKRIYQALKLFVVLAQQLPGGTGGRFSEAFGRGIAGHVANPFNNDLSRKVEPEIEQLIDALVAMQDKTQALRGHAQNQILGPTESVGPSLPVVRYLLIRRDALRGGQGQRQPRIIDVLDSGITLDYAVVDSGVNQANGISAGAKAPSN